MFEFLKFEPILTVWQHFLAKKCLKFFLSQISQEKNAKNPVVFAKEPNSIEMHASEIIMRIFVLNLY